ncbi:nitroreductase family protein [Oscillospiraceae bacterium LTW-04]|nr:nitroreductase family protein [Oscillospiraceae bacterium MB24-C1]
MMESFADLARRRYSVRKFAKKPVEPELLEKVLQAAMLAPTAKNYQSQRIIVATSEESVARLRACTQCHFGAPVLMILAFDTAKASVRATDGKNCGEQDIMIAADHMMLQAADLGLGTTFVGLYDEKALREAFPQLQGLTVEGLMVLGYPAEDAKPSKLHYESLPMEQVVTRV